jgi:hypothetical protein
VNKHEKIKLMKMLPGPDELEGCMPAMNTAKLLVELLDDNKTKIANITLIALLIGTAKSVMREVPDWEEYLRPNNDDDEIEGEEMEIPEPCGDPECKGCKDLEEAIANAPPGTKMKMLRLTREQAEKMGIDVDSAEVSSLDHDDTSEGKSVH